MPDKTMIDKKKSQDDPRLDIVRENIRMAAAKRGLNLSEISRRAGMSRNGVQQFVAGHTSLSFANMMRICDVLAIPIGVITRPDAITDNKIRLYRLLERLPDHLAAQAVAEAEAIVSRQP